VWSSQLEESSSCLVSIGVDVDGNLDVVIDDGMGAVAVVAIAWVVVSCTRSCSRLLVGRARAASMNRYQCW
jgi:hypothetical protein